MTRPQSLSVSVLLILSLLLVSGCDDSGVTGSGVDVTPDVAVVDAEEGCRAD